MENLFQCYYVTNGSISSFCEAVIILAAAVDAVINCLDDLNKTVCTDFCSIQHFIFKPDNAFSS